MQNVSFERVSSGDHGTFAVGFGITGEEERDLAIDEPEPDRAIVIVTVYGCGVDDLNGSRAEFKRFTCPRFVVIGIRVQNSVDAPLKGPAGMDIAGHPHLAYTKPSHDPFALSNVIGMGMGQNEQVDAAHSGLLQ